MDVEDQMCLWSMRTLLSEPPVPNLRFVCSLSVSLLQFLTWIQGCCSHNNNVTATLTVERLVDLPKGWEGYYTTAKALDVVITISLGILQGRPVLVIAQGVKLAIYAFYRVLSAN